MTRCDDLGQFDLTSLVSLLPLPLRDTANDALAIAKNPITGAVKSVEFWSAYSPKVSYSGAELDDIYRDPTPNPYLKFVQPVIVIDSVLGKRTIAPYGVPDPNAWRENTKRAGTAIGSAVFFGGAIVFLLGAAAGRISSRRKSP